MTDRLYFEDIEPGMVFLGDPVTVDRDEMIAFAKSYDAQPMHIDPDAAKAMGLDDVIACDAYIFALSSRSCTAIFNRVHFLPSGLGFQMSFANMARPGDRLQLQVTVAAARQSRKPGRGVLELKQAVLNQDGVSVLDLENVWLVATRPAG